MRKVKHKVKQEMFRFSSVDWRKPWESLSDLMAALLWALCWTMDLL